MLLDRLREEMTRPPFNTWLGPVAVKADESERCVVIELPFRPEFSHTADQTIFHGGVIAALADIAGHATVAVFSTVASSSARGSSTPSTALNADKSTTLEKEFGYGTTI